MGIEHYFQKNFNTLFLEMSYSRSDFRFSCRNGIQLFQIQLNVENTPCTIFLPSFWIGLRFCCFVNEWSVSNSSLSSVYLLLWLLLSGPLPLFSLSTDSSGFSYAVFRKHKLGGLDLSVRFKQNFMSDTTGLDKPQLKKMHCVLMNS